MPEEISCLKGYRAPRDIVIEEKLKLARQRSAKGRMQLGIGLAVAVCLCGLLVVGLSFFDFSPKKIPETDSPKQQPAENDDKKIRQEFIKTLQAYENDLELRLEAATADPLNPEGLSEINALKKKMMSAFSNGEYRIALNHLELLENLTLAMVKQADQVFEENLEKASALLAEEHFDAAKVHIEKALSIYAQSPAALALQQEIEKLPHLLILVNGARAARAENNLQKEYDFLQKLLGVAPEREGVKDRLEVLAGLMKTRTFDLHISSGFAAIEKQQAKKARAHYQSAKTIDPQRPELSMLLDQLLDLEKSLRVQQALSQAEQAIQRDDWYQAKIYFARGAKDAPENKTVTEGLQRADHFIELLTRLNFYFKNPYRLSHEAVRKEAETILAQAEKASGDSLEITRQARQLRELIVRINRPVPVTIISDNKTNIWVRGVGKVGIAAQKNIQLKPGHYTFEGARNGFKSKLIQAFISYDQNEFSVRIICDEPI